MNKSILHFFLVAIILAGLSWSSFALQETGNEETKQPVLNIEHKVHFILDQSEESYSGNEIINFVLEEVANLSAITFVQGTIAEVLVNGSQVTSDSIIPSQLLRVGSNEIEIKFSKAYATNGEAGLYRFKDSKNSEVYVYTKALSQVQNDLFPSFETKGLKSTYMFSVEAPDSWYVISTAPEKFVTFPKEGKKLWVFETTTELSLQLMSLAAGPFKMWKDNSGDIPLQIFSNHIDQQLSLEPNTNVESFYTASFSAKLQMLSSVQKDERSERISVSMIPKTCDKESLAKLQRFIAENQALPLSVLSRLEVAKIVSEKCTELQ